MKDLLPGPPSLLSILLLLLLLPFQQLQQIQHSTEFLLNNPLVCEWPSLSTACRPHVAAKSVESVEKNFFLLHQCCVTAR